MEREKMSLRLDKLTNQVIAKNIGKIMHDTGEVVSKGDYITDLIVAEYKLEKVNKVDKLKNRTTVVIPSEIRSVVNAEAKKKDLTVSQLIKELVNKG